MGSTYELPAPEVVSAALSELLGKPTKATRTTRLPVGPKTPGTVAMYIDEQRKAGAVIFTDLALACAAGGAVSALPQNIVEEGIKSGDVPSNMLESLQEVMAAANAWFERPNVPALKLDAAKSAVGNCSRGLLTMLHKSKNRLDLTIEITGYPKGRIVICVIGKG
jgi:hypothetical protein